MPWNNILLSSYISRADGKLLSYGLLQVYVDRVPLIRAVEYSIIVSSTVVFGAVIIFMYLLYHFKLSKFN